MLELDDALLDHLATVRSHYIACFQDAIRKAQERTGHAEKRVFVEGTFRADDRQLGHLVDLYEKGEDGKLQGIHVVHRSFAPWKNVRYEVEDVELFVGELVWFSVTLIVSPLADVACIDGWFDRWHTKGFDVELPLSGRVHYMCAALLEPLHDGDVPLVAASIDLGSAPVEAVRDLIERCVAAGARSFYLSSNDDALAGRAPA